MSVREASQGCGDAYEFQRMRRIQENREKMGALGIRCTVVALTSSETKEKRKGSRRSFLSKEKREPLRRSVREKKEVCYREEKEIVSRDDVDIEKRMERRVAEALKILDPVAYENAKKGRQERKRNEIKRRGPVDSGKGIRVQGGRVYDSKNGITCHWCRQKTVELHVTCTAPQCAKGRMPISFCERCLKNRHGEDIQDAAISGKWVCPRCRGSCGEGCIVCCNCGPCRKKHGLGPTFQLIGASRKAGFTNVHDFLVHQNTKEDAFKIACRKVNFEWGRWLIESMAGNSDSEASEGLPSCTLQSMGGVSVPAISTEEEKDETIEMDEIQCGESESESAVETSEDCCIENASEGTISQDGLEECSLDEEESFSSEEQLDHPDSGMAKGPGKSFVEAGRLPQRTVQDFMRTRKQVHTTVKRTRGRIGNRVKAISKLNQQDTQADVFADSYVPQALKRKRSALNMEGSKELVECKPQEPVLWTPPISSKLTQMQMPLNMSLPTPSDQRCSPRKKHVSSKEQEASMIPEKVAVQPRVPCTVSDMPSNGCRIKFAFEGAGGPEMSAGTVMSRQPTKASFFKVRFDTEGVLMVKLTAENYGVAWKHE